MKNNNFEWNKGITIIALVITIIILLILAGVTLNMVLRRRRDNKTIYRYS